MKPTPLTAEARLTQQLAGLCDHNLMQEQRICDQRKGTVAMQFDKITTLFAAAMGWAGLADKPPHFWFLALGATLHVLRNNRNEKSLSQRATDALISVLLGFGASPFLHAQFKYDEGILLAATIIFGLVLLDMARALLADVTLPKALINWFLGKKD